MIYTDIDEYLRRAEQHGPHFPPSPQMSYEVNEPTIAATSGAFDILTPGHIELLKLCRQLGNFTVVLLNTDESIRQNKSTARPVKPWEERAEILNAIRHVDCVIGFPQLVPNAAIEKLKPAFWVKGNRPHNEVVELETVWANGGQYIALWTDLKQSSSTYIQKAWAIHNHEQGAQPSKGTSHAPK